MTDTEMLKYCEEYMLESDYKRAFYGLNILVNNHNTRAMYISYYIFRYGIYDQPQNVLKAKWLLESAKNKGDIIATVHLGADEYSNEFAIVKDISDKGDVFATLAVAHNYITRGCIKKGLMLLENEARKGYSFVQWLYSEILLSQGFLDEALCWIEEAIDEDIMAQCSLAGLIINGDVESDDENGDLAFEILSEAVESGYVMAMCPLAMCWFNGIGTEIDFEEYLFWIEKSAESKVLEGMLLVADVHMTKPFMDLEKAEELYVEAINVFGCFDGYYDMALKYLSGDGIRKDVQKGISVLSKLALEYEYAKAYIKLAQLALDEKDHESVSKCVQRLLLLGYEEAYEEISRYIFDTYPNPVEIFDSIKRYM